MTRHTQDGLSAHKDEPLISALLPKTRQPLGHCTPNKPRTPRPGGPGRRGFSNPLTPRPGGPDRRGKAPRPVEAPRIRLPAQPVPVPPPMHGTRLGRARATQPPWRASRADRGGRHRNLVPRPARRGREAPVVEDAAAGRPGRSGFSKLRTRGREAPIAVENPGRRGREAPASVAFEPLVPSRRPGSGYPHSRYPFPPHARHAARPRPCHPATVACIAR